MDGKEFLKQYRAMKLDAFEKKFMDLPSAEQNATISRLISIADLGDVKKEIGRCLK
jgi:hypothetical protein